RQLGNNASRRLDTIEARHAQIHQHDVGTMKTRRGDRLFAVAGFTDDFERGFLFEQDAQAFAKERLIVDQQDADGQRSHAGISTSSSNPPPSPEPARTVPPSRS